MAKIYVEINVIARTENGHIVETISQTINNAIKIGVKFDSTDIDPSKVKFIQFITHQSPCMFTWNRERRAEWLSEGAFTNNMSRPAWKVDTIHAGSWDSPKEPSPFYDDGGLCMLEDDGKFMYDQPGLTSDFERAVATTFIIVDSKVIGEVRWSIQIEQPSPDQRKQITYCVETLETANQLPDWALYVLEDEYGNNGFEKLVYKIPEYLQHKKNQSPSEAQLASSQSFIAPPKDWALSKDSGFAILLPQPQVRIPYQNAFCFFYAMKVTYPENYKTLCKEILLSDRFYIEKIENSSNDRRLK